MYRVIFYTLIVLIGSSESFPQGAPPETCDSFSPERGHGVPSMPVQYAPFSVIAYGRHYRAGDKIPGKFTFLHTLFQIELINLSVNVKLMIIPFSS